MKIDEIPLKDVQALLGEKDMIIYVLSKNLEELEVLRAHQVTTLTDKLEDCGFGTIFAKDRRNSITFIEIQKNG